MKGNTTRIILNERISAINSSKFNNRHYSPKAHFNHSNNKNSLTNKALSQKLKEFQMRLI